MTLWACFCCGSLEICAHREPELVAWAMQTGIEQAQRKVELAQAEELVKRERKKQSEWRRAA